MIGVPQNRNLKFDFMSKSLKGIVGITIMVGVQVFCVAQDLTVHVVTDSSHPKPIRGVAVQLFPGPAMPGRRRVVEQKSDSNGVVIFRNVDLSSIAWSVSVFNLGTTAIDPVVILCRPENASTQGGVRPTITSLPAEITLHVRKRGLGERLQYMFVGP
jgi:hypothetical protein